MKRTFADLHLRANHKDSQQLNSLATKTAELGYKLVATPLPVDTNSEEISKIRKTFNDYGLDYASRTDIRPRSPEDLLNLLRKTRRRFEVLSVQCERKEIARQAAKDHRVDLLNFPFLDYRDRFFDRAEAELASCGSAALEIETKPILILEGASRIRFLSTLRREVAIANEFKVPLIVSSGVTETLMLRKPKEMAVLSSLFGLNGDKAIDAVSANPLRLIAENRSKLQVDFVAPGIRVVKQGEK